MSWQRSFQIFSHKDGPTCFRGWSHQPFAPDSQKFGADMSPTNWIANPMFGIFLGGDSRNVSYAPLLLFISVYPDLCYSTPQRFTLRLQTANPWFYTVLSRVCPSFFVFLACIPSWDSTIVDIPSMNIFPYMRYPKLEGSIDCPLYPKLNLPSNMINI